MDNKLSTSKFAVASGVCFFVLALHQAFLLIESFNRFTLNYNIFLNIISSCSYIAFALLLILRKKNIGLMIAFGVYVLEYALYITNIVNISGLSGLTWPMFRLLCFITLLAFIAFNCISSIQHIAKKINKLWFFPGVMIGIYYMSYWIVWKYFNNLESNWENILLGIVNIAAFLLLCLWLNKTYEYIPAPSKKSTLVNPQKIDPGASNSSFVDGAEQLIEYKQLLDDGVITQEEFDAMKKQILEL